MEIHLKHFVAFFLAFEGGISPPNSKTSRYWSVLQAPTTKGHIMAIASTIKNLILTAFVICSGFCLPSFADDQYRYRNQEWRAAAVSQQEIRAYDYVYYPAQQVYFSPSNNNWFWASGNGWQISTRLPGHLNVDLRFGGIPISLGSQRPFYEHAFVERSYGRPWRDAYAYKSYSYNTARYNDWRYEERHERRHERRYERGFSRKHDRDEWHEGKRHHGHHDRD
jgi:hypothetical protein